MSKKQLVQIALEKCHDELVNDRKITGGL